METLELDIEVSNNATTFNLEGSNRLRENFFNLSESLGNVADKIKSRRRTMRERSTGLQSTFYIYMEGEFVDFTPVQEENEIDYDFVVPLQPKKTYSVKARIKSVEKHSPRIFFD